jgi:Flp pilus assembly protein TadG
MRDRLSRRPAPGRRAGRAQRGAATTSFLLCMVPVFVLLLGMAFDFSQAYTANTRAVNVAEQAARAGAQELDLAEVRQIGVYQLDPGAAVASALRFLGAAGYTGSAVIGTDPASGRQTVEVSTTWSSQNAFLGLVNIGSFDGTAKASARIAVGVDTEVP